MSFIADRMSRIDASGIRKAFALAASLKNPINFSIGLPDYDVADVVKESAITAIRQGKNAYTQTQGLDTLRQGCSDYYQRKYGVPLENVMITAGVSGGLFLALAATVNPGDEVIVADPYFVIYKHLINLLGGTCVTVDTHPNFRLRPDAVEAVITPKSKILIVNSPSNPTGIALTDPELRALAAVAKKHNLLLMSDEIYEQLTYDGKPATMAGKYENTIVLNGFSKMAAMTGWRVGFAAGPADIIQQMNTLQQYTFVCAPSMAQHAAVTALTTDYSANVDAYRRKRDLIYGLLKDNFDVTLPTGAFYIFPAAPGGDGDAFCKKAIENNVIIIPGNVFSARNTHFRISFATSDDNLRKGAEILCRMADQYAATQ
jgi:aspartate/methionine/tyrosine aminotransferase